MFFVSPMGENERGYKKKGRPLLTAFFSFHYNKRLLHCAHIGYKIEKLA